MKSKFPDYENVPITGRVRAVWEFLSSNELMNKVLVDIGCSYGWLEWQLKEKKLKKIYALDPFVDGVAYAKSHIPIAEYFVAPAGKLPIADNTADLAVMFDVIEHVPKGTELEALKEAHRILKNGGVFLLTTPYSHFLSNITDPAWYLGHRHYSFTHIKKLATDAGFAVEDMYARGGYGTIVYMFWFYVMKWIFKKEIPRSKWLEQKDNENYDRSGFFTLFLKCRKIRT